MARRIVGLLLGPLFLPGKAGAQEVCSPVAKADPKWEQLDSQYVRIERATVESTRNNCLRCMRLTSKLTC